MTASERAKQAEALHHEALNEYDDLTSIADSLAAITEVLLALLEVAIDANDTIDRGFA